MSFMNFTLYPNGGAFMMCESISEFDPNMTTQAEREIERLEPAEIAQAVQERVPMDVTYDTVITLARDCYEKYIIPLYNMDLVPGATADITQAAESISQAASEVGETIRRLIVQIQMVASYACCDKYIGESLKSIAGILIKNKSNVIRQGYDHFQANRTEHPVFTYNADALVAKCLEFHDLMKDGILTGETICSLGDYDGTKFGRCFSDIIDMLDVIFEHSDRLNRQSQCYTYSNNVYDMMNMYLNREVYEGEVARPFDRREETGKKLLGHVSHMIRKTKQKMYDIAVDVADPDTDPTSSKQYECFKKSVSMIINTFAISVMYVMSKAYCIQDAMSTHNALDNYCDMMRKEFK